MKDKNGKQIELYDVVDVPEPIGDEEHWGAYSGTVVELGDNDNVLVLDDDDGAGWIKSERVDVTGHVADEADIVNFMLMVYPQDSIWQGM
jgi:hypothetical protein